MVNLTFLSQSSFVQARVGDTILDAALDNRIELPHDCGGNCACTTCHVLIEAGMENLSRMEEVERERLITAEGWTSHSRLGCQAILLGAEVTVRIVDPEGW